MRFLRKIKLIDLLSVTGIRVLVAASVMLGSVLVLYSGYSLYEQLYTQNRAFASGGLDLGDDVLKDEVQDELAQSREDYRAWLRVDDTHIDYPVMQSDNDLYYANHDIDGNSSLTGAIYMAYDNAPDMSDAYIVIFGHHMDNGAMFGDLDRFLDEEFFYKHQKGTLAYPGGLDEITFFAVLQTDAYENAIYSVGNRNLDELVQYIAQHATIMDANAAKGAKQIICLSTCAGAVTNGRLVLFGVLEPSITPIEPTTEETTEEISSEESTPEESTEEETTEEASTEEESTPAASTEAETTEEASTEAGSTPEASSEEPTTSDYTVSPESAAGTGVKERWPIFSGFFDLFMPGGSSYGRNAWAFVNLICLLVTIYILAPVTMLKRKYGRIRKMRKVNEAKNEKIYDVEPFARKFYTGIAIEAVLTLLALLAFIATENMRLPMILIDKWTPLMLILMIGTWTADVLFTRYHRDDREAVKQETEE
ncbi:MAG: class B sortase [Lachnospiraceae bacterium]|nr:class B sortase [Lachnospiraceae bacterium]